MEDRGHHQARFQSAAPRAPRANGTSGFRTDALNLLTVAASLSNAMLGLVVLVPCIDELDDIQRQMCSEGGENTTAPIEQASKRAASYDAG